MYMIYDQYDTLSYRIIVFYPSFNKILIKLLTESIIYSKNDILRLSAFFSKKRQILIICID